MGRRKGGKWVGGRWSKKKGMEGIDGKIQTSCEGSFKPGSV